jgi:gas vesicle protein
MESGKVVLGVLAGVAVGAVLGILLAPEKGSVTRSQILGKGEDYADRLSKKFEGLMETASKNYDEMLHTAGELSAKGKAKLDGFKKDANTIVG